MSVQLPTKALAVAKSACFLEPVIKTKSVLVLKNSTNNDTLCIVWGHLKIVSFSINPFASLSTNERILEFTFSSHRVLYH